MATGRRVREAGGPLLGAVTILVIMVVLHLLGRGALAAPPYRSVEDLRAWLGDRGPVAAAVVAVRLLALGVGYHLIVTTALSVIGRLLSWPGLVRLADASTLPPFRSIVRRVAGLGLSASMLMATPLEAAHPVEVHSPPAATLEPAHSGQRGDAGATGRPTEMTLRWTSPGAPTAPGTVTMQPDDAPSPDGTATLSPAASPPPTASTATLTPADRGPDDEGERREPSVHQVVHGDHLWSIAEQHLAAILQRDPSDDEIAPYWRRVVAANPQLVNPDLIFTGDLIQLPPAVP